MSSASGEGVGAFTFGRPGLDGAFASGLPEGGRLGLGFGLGLGLGLDKLIVNLLSLF